MLRIWSSAYTEGFNLVLHISSWSRFLVHYGTNLMSSSSNGFVTFAVTITQRGKELFATVAPHSFAIVVFIGILTLSFFLCCDHKPPGGVQSADISAIVAYVQSLTLWGFAEDFSAVFLNTPIRVSTSRPLHESSPLTLEVELWVSQTMYLIKNV
jgi:hypothetical protein